MEASFVKIFQFHMFFTCEMAYEIFVSKPSSFLPTFLHWGCLVYNKVGMMMYVRICKPTKQMQQTWSSFLGHENMKSNTASILAIFMAALEYGEIDVREKSLVELLQNQKKFNHIQEPKD